VAAPRRPRQDPLLHALGVAVISARERTGLSQEEVGFRAELDRTYVSGIERGVRNPTIRTLRRLAAALKTRASSLLREAEDRAVRA